MIWGEQANPYKHSYLDGLQRIEVSVRRYLDWRKNSLNISRFLSCVALCMCLRLDHSCFILGHLICGKCAYYYVCTCVQGGASNQIFGGPERKIITLTIVMYTGWPRGWDVSPPLLLPVYFPILLHPTGDRSGAPQTQFSLAHGWQ